MSTAPWMNPLRRWLGVPPRKARRTRARQHLPAVCRVEQLEDRCLLSATLLADINSDTLNSNPSNFVNYKGALFFAANDGVNGQALWRSDGTAAGTTLVKDVRPS